jgi:hypothetical protein
MDKFSACKDPYLIAFQGFPVDELHIVMVRFMVEHDRDVNASGSFARCGVVQGSDSDRNVHLIGRRIGNLARDITVWIVLQILCIRSTSAQQRDQAETEQNRRHVQPSHVSPYRRCQSSSR